MITVLETPTFSRHVKKLHSNQKADLDAAIATLIENPELGESKRGDLLGIKVHKFKMVGQLTLLAYSWDAGVLVLKLLQFGSHENFYRDMKR